MDIVAKLQIKQGQRIAFLAATADVPAITIDDVNPPAAAGEADVTVAFVRGRADLATVALPAIEAARRDHLAWIAYPKAGRLGTDLNRDTLAAALSGEGIQPVRQVAIDETWSALRFRPALAGILITSSLAGEGRDLGDARVVAGRGVNLD